MTGISRSRTERASRVERAQMLLAYPENPSFFAVSRIQAEPHFAAPPHPAAAPHFSAAPHLTAPPHAAAAAPHFAAAPGGGARGCPPGTNPRECRPFSHMG